MTTQWHRVHPFSPFLDSWLTIATAVAVIFAAGQDMVLKFGQALLDGDTSAVWRIREFIAENGVMALIVVAGLTVVLALIVVGNLIEWKTRAYALTPEAVLYRKGWVAKLQRKAPLDRVQSIYIKQPFLPRLFGLATLTFDVAGGQDSEVVIAYLPKAKAENLRDELLERVRVLKNTPTPAHPSDAQVQALEHTSTPAECTDTAAPFFVEKPASQGVQNGGSPVPDATPPAQYRPGTPAGKTLFARLNDLAGDVAFDIAGTLDSVVAPYRVNATQEDASTLVRVPTHRGVLAPFLSLEVLLTLVSLLLVLGATVGVPLFVGNVSLGSAVAGVLGVAGGAWALLKHNLDLQNFVVSISEDGLMVSHGLTSTTRRVIPIDRVQAVQLKQDILWRKCGWWKIVINTASAEPEASAQTVLLPVGTYEQAITVLSLVLPEPGVDEGAGYHAGDLLYELCTLPRTGSASTPAGAYVRREPGAAKWLNWMTWRSNAWLHTRTMLVVRSGWLTRKVSCVPHARVQSLQLSQGPLQRKLKLATIRIHSTAGPIKPEIKEVHAGKARALLEEYAVITRRARALLDGREFV